MMFIATSPDQTIDATTATKRNITFATWGKGRVSINGGEVRQTEWTHIGWSSSADAAKAAKSGRATNKYFAEYAATPVTEVK